VHRALGSAHVLVRAGTPHPVSLIDFEKAKRSRWARRADLRRFRRRSPYLDAADWKVILGAYRQTYRDDILDRCNRIVNRSRAFLRIPRTRPSLLSHKQGQH
jgi:hypothetical protein